MKSKGTLKKDTIVATVMSNLGFFLMAEKNAIHMEKTKVGDRYVLERMKEIGASLGGEQSGHIIFLDENTTGDGLLSALHLLQVMVDTEKPLSELAKVMEVLPQALVNAKVANHKKEKYMEYPEIAAAIGKLEEKFAGEGRVLIRPSGTAGKSHDRRKGSAGDPGRSPEACQPDTGYHVLADRFRKLSGKSPCECFSFML